LSAVFRLSLAVVLLATSVAVTAGAQRLPPQIESYQVSDSLLPVLDDFGIVIPERLIRVRVRPRKGMRVGLGLVGAVAGALIGTALSTPEGNPDCSIYEPCSDREKFYQGTLPVFGFLLGFFLTAVIPDYGTDRFEAIEKIRAERRARQGGIPR
jgi:hypothetical protein